MKLAILYRSLSLRCPREGPARRLPGPTVAGRLPLHAGRWRQPVGGEHALTVDHPGRFRVRTTDPVVRVSNDRVRPGVAVTDGTVAPA